MKAIIDADSLVYIIGWYCKDLPQAASSYEQVIKQTDDFMFKILQDCKATKYVGFMGGVHPTFRHMMNPEYKANRGTTKPDWYMKWGGVISHRLFHYWRFNLIEGIEAEDAVSIMACNERFLSNIDHVIVHIDKDLNQIPGIHYNYKDGKTYIISISESEYNLYFQVLKGDRTDNVPGLKGCGDVGAKHYLNDTGLGYDFRDRTFNAFCSKLGNREGIIQFSNSYLMVCLLTGEQDGFKLSNYSYLPVPSKNTGVPEAYDVEKLFNLEGNEPKTTSTEEYFVPENKNPEEEA